MKLNIIPIEFDRVYLKDDKNLSDEDDIRDMIICAYNNSIKYPEEAIDNLVNAIRKIQSIMDKQK